MKIYTRKGDKGLTSIIGGTKLGKDHIRIEAYGTIDELNSWIGLVRDILTDDSLQEMLISIQDKLFIVGSLLASDPEKARMKLPMLDAKDIEILEKMIDSMEVGLSEMRAFILPGGAKEVSYCHIARAVCRRAERIVVKLNNNATIPSIIIIYLNRLSDFLFVLSRKISHDLSVREINWPLNK